MFKWLKKKVGYYDVVQDIVSLRADMNSLAEAIEKLKLNSSCASKSKVDEDMRTLSKRLDDELSLISKSITLLTETDKKLKAEIEAMKKDSVKVKAPSNRKPK